MSNQHSEPPSKLEDVRAVARRTLTDRVLAGTTTKRDVARLVESIETLAAEKASLEEQLEALRNCIEEYADLDNWEAVRSPETTSAWQKRWGHPTPWVDAQEALERVSNPASKPPDTRTPEQVKFDEAMEAADDAS